MRKVNLEHSSTRLRSYTSPVAGFCAIVECFLKHVVLAIGGKRVISLVDSRVQSSILTGIAFGGPRKSIVVGSSHEETPICEG